MRMRLNRIPLLLCLALLAVVTAACRGDRAPDATGTTGAAVKVTDVTLGRAVGGDKAITDKTDNFSPNDTIYASVATEGSATSSTLRARWTYQAGQVDDDESHTIEPNTRESAEIHNETPDGEPPSNGK